LNIYGSTRKIRLIVTPGVLVNSGDLVALWEPCEKKISKMIRELDDCIERYFANKHKLNDFKLSNIIIAKNTKLESFEKVSAYLGFIINIGRIKGFKRLSKNKAIRYELVGVSNGIEFSAFNMELDIKQSYPNAKNKVKKKAVGVLCFEIRLMTQKAICKYTNKNKTSAMIIELAEKCFEIFANTVIKVIPYGDIYKKNKAVKIVESNLKNTAIRRKMLRLLELIPKKKSIYLAQKELGSRYIDEVMAEFYDLKLSPVTLSKRQKLEFLENLYNYL